MKKAKKASKKAAKSSSSSSSSADSAAAEPPLAARLPAFKGSAERQGDERRARSRSGGRGGGRAAPEPLDLKALGPSAQMVNSREDRAARVAEQKRLALESRGAPRRMTEEEKNKKFEQMKRDAQSHDAHKNKRIAEAERKDKEIAEAE